MTLSVRKFTVGLSGLIFFFFAAHLVLSWIQVYTGHDYILGLAPLFRVTGDESVSNWYSILALTVCSFLLFMIYNATAERSEKYARHWLGLAIIFLFLSADQACSIHAKLSVLMREHVHSFGLEHGQWIVVYAIPMLAFAAFFLPFLKALWPKPGVVFVVAGIVFVSGAAGLELIGSYYSTATRMDSADGLYLILAGTEELLEMLGILIWMRALLVYIEENNISLQVKLRP